eukprot:2343834-Prymnesium_polylepis.1
MVYGATDQLIQTINAHSAEWGVKAQYTTASEYVDALLNATRTASAVATTASAAGATAATPGAVFPVVANGSSFFPYRTGTTSATPEQDWSGYFTSRPILKRLSTLAHNALGPAEVLFALHGRSLSEQARLSLWPSLEGARRKAAIFQHHDAITGTFCSYTEGCIGGLNSEDQDVGSHDVLGDYRQMLTSSIDDAHDVLVGVLPAALADTAP